eukprot:4480837-Pleurochrysis_carterae.AAC.1
MHTHTRVPPRMRSRASAGTLVPRSRAHAFFSAGDCRAQSDLLRSSEYGSLRPVEACTACMLNGHPLVSCFPDAAGVLITSSEAPDAVSEAFGLIPGCSLSAANGAEASAAHAPILIFGL